MESLGGERKARLDDAAHDTRSWGGMRREPCDSCGCAPDHVAARFVSFPFGGAGRDHITNSFSTDDEGLFPSVNSV